MQSIFITATNTNIGKTYVTKLLIKKLSKQGYKVGVFKPIETGVKNIALDSNELLECVKLYNDNFNKFTTKDITPYQFKLPASPFVAKKRKVIKLSKILKQYKKLKKECDILLIEGAGGLFVPIEQDFYMIDLIKLLKAKTLLVTSSKLGSINDTLLSINFLQSKNLKFEWCINLYEDKDSFFKVTYPFYKEKFKKIMIVQKNINQLLKKI